MAALVDAGAEIYPEIFVGKSYNDQEIMRKHRWRGSDFGEYIEELLTDHA